MSTRHVGAAGLFLFGAVLACGRAKPPTPTVELASATALASPDAGAAPSLTAAGAPTSCTASSPVTLRAGISNGSSPVSVALTSDTAWVLYLGKSDTPVLLEVRSFQSATPQLVEHELPAGNVGSSSALAVSQTGIVGTYVGRKGVVFFSMSKAEPDVFTVPAGEITSGGSLAVVGAKALTAFGQDDDGVHLAWFDVASGARQGAFEKIGGKVQQPAVAGAFGGLTVFADFSRPESPGVLRARGASGAPFALPAVGKDNGSSAAASGLGDRAYVLFNVIGPRTPGAMLPENVLKLATLTDEHGNGTTVELGTPGMVPENAIQAAPWGAMGAFLGLSGAVMVAAVDRTGRLAVAPMRVTTPGEHARAPAVAVAGLEAVAIWNQIGAPAALRMSVIRCK